MIIQCFMNIIIQYHVHIAQEKRDHVMPKSKKFDQIVYNNAYNKSHYTNCSLRLKPDIMQKIDYYCTKNNISKTSFFVKAAMYIIDQNIDISAQTDD